MKQVNRRRVMVASPYAGDVEQNTYYAQVCTADSINKGESPITPHLLYTQVLDDRIDIERAIGMSIGLGWLEVVDALVVYQDLGISSGMQEEIERATQLGVTIEYRNLDYEALT